ncbi:transmembrane protein 254-like [Glandiceps talaboti]
MTRNTKEQSDYFVVTPTRWIILITFGMSFFTLTCFRPDLIPYKYLGPFGTFDKYLVDNHSQLLRQGYVLAWGIHITESFLTIPMCRKRRITDVSARVKWFVQTLLFGIGSLHYLMKYKPNKMK